MDLPELSGFDLLQLEYDTDPVVFHRDVEDRCLGDAKSA